MDHPYFTSISLIILYIDHFFIFLFGLLFDRYIWNDPIKPYDQSKAGKYGYVLTIGQDAFFNTGLHNGCWSFMQFVKTVKLVNAW